MLQFKTYIPEGVSDIHWDEYEAKDKVIMHIKKRFKSFGYRQILTPTFEYYDLFAGVDGTIHRDEMFKFIDGNGKILVLRPDVTVPIARMAATSYGASKGYLKFSYIANVFRISEEQSGNKREFMQAGIEYLGSEKPDADAEIVAVGIKTLIDSGLKNFQIDLGQAAYFKGLMTELDMGKEKKDYIRKLIEEKNFAELTNMLKTLDMEETIKNVILRIPSLYGEPVEVIAHAKTLAINEKMKRAVDYLQEVYDILKDYGYQKYVTIDFGLVNHLDYYSGVIFKGYVHNYGKSLISGGRYDNLTKQYGEAIPATGLGINIDELMEVIEMNSTQKAATCYTDYLILYNSQKRGEAFELAENLRNKGYIVECDLNEEDIKKQIKNADFRNIKEIIQFTEENLKIINIRNNQIRKNTSIQFLKSLETQEVFFSIH
ncbi:MAG: ATP phosphoribosyltransferase regulatory subunit [Thermotaleaceae bacterium]